MCLPVIGSKEVFLEKCITADLLTSNLELWDLLHSRMLLLPVMRFAKWVVVSSRLLPTVCYDFDIFNMNIQQSNSCQLLQVLVSKDIENSLCKSLSQVESMFR